MKRTIITLCLVLALATPAHAGEWFTWDEANTNLHVPLTLLTVVDLGQTLWIADNPQTHKEKYSYLLPEHPGEKDVWRAFALAYAVDTFITYALPSKYSHAYQGGVIALRLYMVENNYSIGIGVKF
jgi:hypothetical protein